MQPINNMNFKRLAYFLFFKIIFFIHYTQTKELPSFVPRCNISGTDFKECVINATDIMRPYLKKGIPQMNLPSCEPLIIPKLTLEQTSQGGNYKCVFTDFELNGLTKYIFNGFDYNLNSKELYLLMNFTFDNIYLKSKYLLDGRILLVPIHGEGNFTGNINKAHGIVEFFNDFIIKDDLKYLNIRKTNIQLTFNKNNKIYFDRLIQGSAVISEATRHFFRENVDLILEEVLPSIQIVLNELIKELGQNILSAFPYESLFYIN